MENDLIAYIAEHVPELAGYIYPVYGKELEHPSMIYGTIKVEAGPLNTNQFNVKVIAKSYDDCKTLSEKVANVLDMSGDSVYRIFGETRFRSNLSGGAEIISYEVGGTEVFEAALYFIVKWRKINVTR